MDESNRNQRGNISGRESSGQGIDAERGEDQEGSGKPKTESRSFLQNGLEHVTHSSRKVITLVSIALSLPIGGIFVAGYKSVKFGYSEIDSRIYEKAPDAPIDRNYTIEEKFKTIDESLILLKDKADRCEKLQDKVEDIRVQITARRGK